MNIYKTAIKYMNGSVLEDLWCNYDDAYSYGNGVSMNSQCIEAKMYQLSDEGNSCSRLENETEVEDFLEIIHDCNKEHIGNPDVIPVDVYYDTINHLYNEDQNIATIFVPKSFMERWIIKHDLNEYYSDFDDFYNNYICDDVDGLYDDAKAEGVMHGWKRWIY